jgi:putative endonuclease
LKTYSRASRNTYRTGLLAEWLSRMALRLKGYRIIARRYRSKLGEIDIIAARGKNLVFVEVKARPSLVEASACITKRQRERLFHAAADFLARHGRYIDFTLRFDAMLAVPWRWPVHIENAWQPSN